MNLSGTLARLQAERQESNYRLAKLIGVHQSTIKNWKNGTKPHPEHIKLLAEHYGVPEEKLMKGGEEYASGEAGAR